MFGPLPEIGSWTQLKKLLEVQKMEQSALESYVKFQHRGEKTVGLVAVIEREKKERDKIMEEERQARAAEMKEKRRREKRRESVIKNGERRRESVIKNGERHKERQKQKKRQAATEIVNENNKRARKELQYAVKATLNKKKAATMDSMIYI